MSLAYIDGTWARIVDMPPCGKILELRDPNHGIGSDPARKPRHQALVAQIYDQPPQLYCRVLPPECVGDRWRDPDATCHIWQIREVPPTAGGPIAAWCEHCGMSWKSWLAAPHAVVRALLHDTGREVRMHCGRFEIQPPVDNWWAKFESLDEALLWYVRRKRGGAS